VTIRCVDKWISSGVLATHTPAEAGSVGSQVRVLIPFSEVREVSAARARLKLRGRSAGKGR
jgi:hypothetical protein